MSGEEKWTNTFLEKSKEKGEEASVTQRQRKQYVSLYMTPKKRRRRN